MRAELERILASRCFEQAGRSSKFLRFVVEQTLAGQGDRLKGYTVAVEVFGRPADFDAQSDPLVRVEAGRLRRRLTEYYADEGRNDPLRIELPRGSYAVTSTYHPPPAAVLLGPMPQDVNENAVVRNRRRWRRIRTVLIGVVVLAGIAIVLMQQLELSRRGAASSDVAARARSPGKPSIVVQPFQALTGEPAVGELAAALREEILLLFDDPELLVVATQVGAGGVADEGDGSGYILSGSVRAAGEQLRITARLLEARTRRQIWSDAWDEPRAAASTPAAARAYAARMAGVAAPYGPIFESELEALRGVPSTELTLADCTLKYYEFRRVLDRARHADALECYEVATEQQPDSPDAWAMLALLAAEQYAHGYGGRAASPLDEAREAARRAMDIDGNSLHANLALAATRFFGGEDFRPVAERILGTWPDNAEARAFVGAILILTGDTDRGRELVQGALATTERAPSGYYASNALAELRAGDIDAALASALRIDSPDWPLGHVLVAALATLAGRADLAARAKARALELEPTMATLLPELLRRWRAEAALAAEVERGFVEAGGP